MVSFQEELVVPEEVAELCQGEKDSESFLLEGWPIQLSAVQGLAEEYGGFFFPSTLWKMYMPTSTMMVALSRAPRECIAWGVMDCMCVVAMCERSGRSSSS